MFVIKKYKFTEEKKINTDSNELPSFTNKVNLKAKWTYSKTDKITGYENETKLKISPNKKNSQVTSAKKKLYELISCEGEFSVTVGTSILKNSNKANTLTEFVTINMIKDNPIRLDYNLNDDGSIIYYYISPKLDD